jgi:hypothetical protein
VKKTEHEKVKREYKTDFTIQITINTNKNMEDILVKPVLKFSLYSMLGFFLSF